MRSAKNLALFVTMFALAGGCLSAGQEQPQGADGRELKKEIQEKVDKRLETQREEILKQVGKLLDEKSAAASVSLHDVVKEHIARLEKHRGNVQKALVEQKDYLDHLEKLSAQSEWAALAKTMIPMTREVIENHQALIASYNGAIAKLQKLAGSGSMATKSPAPKQTKPAPPAPKPAEEMTMEEAADLFDESLQLHQEKQFDEAIKGFERIYHAFTQEDVGITSAYNIACGYALKGEKTLAVEWLVKSVDAGFDKFDHIRADADLDSLRDEPGYKELMKRETN
ncbi:MAG: hypothetical protein A2Z34_08530 [Planctomycetes bacterium RBG_16_59_8]|nr:MAG: hypothetical protein A2Z34_08530 [Planctomycetes bacterium RBG_16_59_8]